MPTWALPAVPHSARMVHAMALLRSCQILREGRDAEQLKPGALDKSFYLDSLRSRAALPARCVRDRAPPVISSRQLLRRVFMTQQSIQLGSSCAHADWHTTSHTIGQDYVPGCEMVIAVATFGSVIGSDIRALAGADGREKGI